MKALLVLLLASVCALGQTRVYKHPVKAPLESINCAKDQTEQIIGHDDGTFEQRCAPPKPLKCGKYEHVVYQREQCLSDGCFMASSEPFCAPIMHEVTEKEWAELTERREFQDRRIDVLNFELQKLIQAAQSYQERLKALEHPGPTKGACFEFDKSARIVNVACKKVAGKE